MTPSRLRGRFAFRVVRALRSDLLDAHHRGDAQAADRIRDALPAFGDKSNADILDSPFALHDAQSVIAREYGLPSWSDLRGEVARLREGSFPSVMFKAMEPQLRAMWGRPMPASVADALKDAWTKDVRGSLQSPLPENLPLLAIRNALLVPGVLAPFHVARPASLAALDEAARLTPSAIATFAQRDAADEDVRTESVHPIGCQALVHARIPTEDGKAFVVLRGLRWIAIERVEPSGGASPALIARVSPIDVDDVDEGEDGPALFGALKARTKQLAAVMPGGAEVARIVDGIDDPERLADLLVGNLLVPVDAKAAYAAEGTVARKLRAALALVEGAAASR